MRRFGDLARRVEAAERQVETFGGGQGFTIVRVSGGLPLGRAPRIADWRDRAGRHHKLTALPGESDASFDDRAEAVARAGSADLLVVGGLRMPFSFFNEGETHNVT